ncbi:hypothetical protein DFH09DRAFT_1451847 [Mycena vulgaris]|nr:hypothetical protein DFH09DRAFT_1451847 [Mycena vulgaris]
MSILRPMEQSVARLGLPAYSRSNDDDSDGTHGKVLHKWLDTLASLLVGSSPGSPSNQSSCTVTVALNVRPSRSGDVPELVHSIWTWMKDASLLPEEDSKKNDELLELILEAYLDRIRRRLKDKGNFVVPLIAKAEKADLTELQQTFLMTAHLLHLDILKRLGPDVEKPDFCMASQAFRFRIKAYEAAKSKLEDLYWLHPFESQMVKCTSLAFRDPEQQSHAMFAAGAKMPSLVRYLDKLQKPYSQYVIIRKAVRKSFIRDALSIPLQVKVLPSPDPTPCSAFQSMVDFETRVRSYLRGALLSYSTDAADSLFAGDAIDFFWQRIQKVLDAHQGQLPPLLAAHCECILLSHHLDLDLHDIASTPKGAPYPYIGVSKLSCFQCTLYFQAYKACELGPSFQTRGSHGKIFACAVPASGRHKVDKAIGNEMGAQLEKIIGHILAVEINGRRKMTSTGSSPSSPPSDEEYVDVLTAEVYVRPVDITFVNFTSNPRPKV